MPDRWLYDSPHIRHSVQTILCVSGDAGRAVVLRIEPPVASRPFGLSSLRPSRLSALRTAFAGASGLVCCFLHRITPFSPSRSARACTLASWRPSVEP